MRHGLGRMLVLSVVAGALGCGNSNETDPNNNNNNVTNPTITLSPSAPQSATAGGQAITFTATVNPSGSTVTWTLSGSGSISATTGTTTSYTPPASLSTAEAATLTASTPGASGNVTASVTINIAPTPVGVTIAPSSTQSVVAGGAAVPFTATATGTTSAVTWSLTGPGTLSTTSGATTSYTPPAAAAVSSATSATLTASVSGATASVTINIAPAPASITIDPPSATVVAGGATQAFTATLVNATGSITWALTGPGSISVTSGNGTTYTPPTAGSVTSATTATLKASSGSLNSSATITINPADSITVAGTVLGENGLPADNCTVAIVGRQNAVTDSQGKFSIANVTVPYDLAVVNTSLKLAVIYQGLTRPDPYVYFWGFNPGTQRTAVSVSGTLNNSHLVNTALPFPRAAPAVVTFGSPQVASAVLATGVVPAAFNFTNLQWYGGATVTGTLSALQWDWDSNSLPTGNWLYGSTSDVGISAGGTLANQVLAMTPLAPTSVTGSVNTVPNMTLRQKAVQVDFPSGGFVPIVIHTDSTAAFSYNTPSVSSTVATLSVVAIATLATNEVSFSFRKKLATNASNVVLDLRDPPVLTNPVDLGTNIGYSDEFRWTKFAGGVQVMVVTAGATDPWYAVFTMSDRTHLPQLSTFGISGMDLPAATQYQWSVFGEAPFTSIDDAAGPGLWFPSGDAVYEGDSLLWKFTTR
jgi:hypothetical protein